MFQEAKPLNLVSEFHKVCGHPIQEKYKIPTEDRVKLRIELLEEELNEFKEAIKANDIKLVADALCDLQYVLSGAILEFGLGKYFNELFNEVQKSNLSKFCKSKEEAIKSIEIYKRKGIDCEYEKRNGLYIIYRKSDNKIMKSYLYSPVSFAKILITNE